VELDSAMDIITTPFEGSYIEHPSRKKFLPKESSNDSSINRTQTGKVFKPDRLEQQDLKKQYLRFSKKQLAEVRWSLRKDGLIL